MPLTTAAAPERTQCSQSRRATSSAMQPPQALLLTRRFLDSPPLTCRSVTHLRAEDLNKRSALECGEHGAKGLGLMTLCPRAPRVCDQRYQARPSLALTSRSTPPPACDTWGGLLHTRRASCIASHLVNWPLLFLVVISSLPIVFLPLQNTKILRASPDVQTSCPHQ